jgi:hypothetical protein
MAFGFTDPRLSTAQMQPGWMQPGPVAAPPLQPGFRAPQAGGMNMGGMGQQPQMGMPQMPMMPFGMMGRPQQPQTTREGGSGGGMGTIEDPGMPSNDDSGFGGWWKRNIAGLF